jgi:ElaB/YqjD/DUF883 family membrane-anchored ribosome-binding protein
MAAEADMIRDQINATRAALQAKLQTLEAQVRERVGSVADRVQQTRAAVEQTAESVRRSLNLRYQINERPWAFVGGALAVGTLVGYSLAGARRQGISPISRGGAAMRGDEESAASVAALASSDGIGLLSRLAEPFRPELNKVKGMAVGFLMTAVRDMLKDSIPPAIAPSVEEILRDVTTKMGGTLMEEPILSAFQEHLGRGRSHEEAPKREHAGSRS